MQDQDRENSGEETSMESAEGGSGMDADLNFAETASAIDVPEFDSDPPIIVSGGGKGGAEGGTQG